MAKVVDKRTVGAWLLHHDQKLISTKTTEFESIVTAGRSARLLSVISREEEATVSSERLQELARGIGVRRIELGGLLSELQSHGLIHHGSDGVAVLGVSQVSLLDHASDIFEAQSPDGMERAVIHLSEMGSHSPIRRSDCAEELADTYSLSKPALDDVFLQSEHIGFVDYERDGMERLYFNGSLFKRNNAGKSRAILDNLNETETKSLLVAEEALKQRGCLLADEIRHLLGPILWSKMHQIGFFEVSVVVNERGSTEFVSKPEALVKYVPNGLADMLDDAKALASSLTYGIIKSPPARGKIMDPFVLINVLINRGYVEGWAPAIKRDYQTLEKRGVVRVTESERGNRLTLLKREVGQMARDLILRGDASATAAEALIGNQVSRFLGPESARMIERKKEIPEAKIAASRSLNILRRAR